MMYDKYKKKKMKKKKFEKKVKSNVDGLAYAIQDGLTGKGKY